MPRCTPGRDAHLAEMVLADDVALADATLADAHLADADLADMVLIDTNEEEFTATRCSANIDGYEIKAIIDTGAACCAIT